MYGSLTTVSLGPSQWERIRGSLGEVVGASRRFPAVSLVPATSRAESRTRPARPCPSVAPCPTTPTCTPMSVRGSVPHHTARRAHRWHGPTRALSPWNPKPTRSNRRAEAFVNAQSPGLAPPATATPLNRCFCLTPAAAALIVIVSSSSSPPRVRDPDAKTTHPDPAKPPRAARRRSRFHLPRAIASHHS
jgi:hypothetical protein